MYDAALREIYRPKYLISSVAPKRRKVHEKIVNGIISPLLCIISGLQ